MEIRVNATRMDLLKLRRRLELARRGHKLLKDKLDGLVQHFIKTSKELRLLYNELDKGLKDQFNIATLAAVEVDPLSLKAALTYPTVKLKLSSKKVNLMGVKTDKFNLDLSGETKCWGDKFFTENFGKLLDDLRELLPKMVKLAELYKTICRIGKAITDIKRRVNALEYILIPELDDKVRFIRMKLSEMERSNIVSLMKIKEIVQTGRS